MADRPNHVPSYLKHPDYDPDEWENRFGPERDQHVNPLLAPPPQLEDEPSPPENANRVELMVGGQGPSPPENANRLELLIGGQPFEVPEMSREEIVEDWKLWARGEPSGHTRNQVPAGAPAVPPAPIPTPEPPAVHAIRIPKKRVSHKLTELREMRIERFRVIHAARPEDFGIPGSFHWLQCLLKHIQFNGSKEVTMADLRRWLEKNHHLRKGFFPLIPRGQNGLGPFSEDEGTGRQHRIQTKRSAETATSSTAREEGDESDSSDCVVKVKRPRINSGERLIPVVGNNGQAKNAISGLFGCSVVLHVLAPPEGPAQRAQPTQSTSAASNAAPDSIDLGTEEPNASPSPSSSTSGTATPRIQGTMQRAATLEGARVVMALKEQFDEDLRRALQVVAEEKESRKAAGGEGEGDDETFEQKITRAMSAGYKKQAEKVANPTESKDEEPKKPESEA